MQAIADHPTPNNNRLFMLDLDLQVQIFTYAGLFNEWSNRPRYDVPSHLRRLFEKTRWEPLYYDKLYFARIYAGVVHVLFDRKILYCAWCEVRLPVASVRTSKQFCEFIQYDYVETYDEDKDEYDYESDPRQKSDCWVLYHKNFHFSNSKSAHNGESAHYPDHCKNRIGDYKNGIYTPEGFTSHACDYCGYLYPVHGCC